jgi:DNA-binding NtrC family response regulator
MRLLNSASASGMIAPMLPGAPSFQEAENIQTARSMAARLAKSDLPMLITGEVGTGRRTLADAVASARANAEVPVVTFTAFEGLPSELRERQGRRFVGVVHHVHALGSREQMEIAAMVRDHRLLLVAVGKTGEAPLVTDLRALVEGTHIQLPPVRDREGDAVQWAEFFAARAAAELGGATRSMSDDARRAVASHSWPGNLSELESVMRRAVVLADSDIIEPSDLGFAEKLVVEPLNDAVERFRMAYVSKVLAHFNGNRTQAARALGVDARTIFRYLAKTKDET